MTFFDEKLKEKVSTYIKTKKQLTEAEIEKIIPIIKEDYKRQLGLPIDDRLGYINIDGADYVVFKTDEEPFLDANKKLLNKPKIVGGKRSEAEKEKAAIEAKRLKKPIEKKEDETWMIWPRFPLLTDDSFAKRITIFDKAQKPKYLNWKIIVLAKGRINVQYKILGATENPLKQDPFVKVYNKAKKSEEGEDFMERTFEDIDPAEYIRYYSFNLDQVLEMSNL